MMTLGVTACAVLPGRRSETPPPRQSPTRDSLLALDLSRSDSLGRRGVAAAMRPFLDGSAIYLRAGAHVAYGAERAMRLLQSPVPEAAPFVGWQPLGGGVSRDLMAGYTFGIAVRALPDQPVTNIERYIAFWSRTRSGPWRITAYVEVSPGSLSTIVGDKPSPVAGAGGPPAARALVVADSQFGEKASALGPAAAMRDRLSPEGVLLTTTQLVVGPAAASDYFESQRTFSITWIPRDARIAATGDLGFTVGDAVSTSLGPTGAARQRFTKYLTVWRKEDGRWLVAVTGANDRPSPIGD